MGCLPLNFGFPHALGVSEARETLSRLLPDFSKGLGLQRANRWIAQKIRILTKCRKISERCYQTLSQAPAKTTFREANLQKNDTNKFYYKVLGFSVGKVIAERGRPEQTMNRGPKLCSKFFKRKISPKIPSAP